MPLSLAQLEEIREECMAEDVDIDLDRMARWSEETARTFFENGGEAEHEMQGSCYVDGSRPAEARGVLSSSDDKAASHALPDLQVSPTLSWRRAAVVTLRSSCKL